MKRSYISIVVLVSAMLLAGCDKSDGGRSHSGWSAPVCPASEISVSSSGKEVEKYAFSYDKNKRLESMKRTDVLGSKALLDVRYVYGGDNLTIDGVIGGTASGIEVSDGKKGLDYTGKASRSWTYHVAIGKDGIPTYTAVLVKFDSNSGKLSSETSYYESYTTQGGDICQITTGNIISGDSKTETTTFSESALTTVYKYCANEDRQNFNALLMDCALPVWYAKGLPGCRHLISDIEVFGGALDYKARQHIDYTFDENGNILEAVRTWSSAGEEYLKMTYNFSY